MMSLFTSQMPLAFSKDHIQHTTEADNPFSVTNPGTIRSAHSLESFVVPMDRELEKVSFKPEFPTRPFPCPHSACGKSFSRKSALRDHMQGLEHGNKKPFNCALCTKAFTRLNDLKRHEGEVHGDKRFLCENALPTGERWGCGKRFTRLVTLKQHQKDCPSFNKPDVRPWSQITWPSAPEARLRHSVTIEIRKGRPPSDAWEHEADHFVCKICRARRRKSLLPSFVQHLLGHLEDVEYRAFRCEKCDVSFALQTHLNSHKVVCGKFECVLRSGGANPVDVWGCGEQFKSLDEFNNHWHCLDGDPQKQSEDEDMAHGLPRIRLELEDADSESQRNGHLQYDVYPTATWTSSEIPSQSLMTLTQPHYEQMPFLPKLVQSEAEAAAAASASAAKRRSCRALERNNEEKLQSSIVKQLRDRGIKACRDSFPDFPNYIGEVQKEVLNLSVTVKIVH
jgi:hypothetical protein